MKNWKYIDGAEVGNEKAISSTFHINDYGVEVGQWSWDWRGKAPDENKQKEIERKIKSYVQQINKNVPAGDSDERDAVFSQLDKFVRAQGLNKKTGNDTPAEYFSKKPKVIGNEKTGAEGFFKQLSDDVKEREKKDDEDIEKVGNANLETSVEKGKLGLWNWYVHKDGTIVSGGTSSTETNAKEMARKALEKEKAGNKVGNATYDMTERDYENEYKSLVQKRNNVQKGTKEYEEVQKRLDEIRKKLGRSPFGNKIGNTASDDKFAYVMREFDEGKLKTPDGKVVTDPEQAKAIAYSESKKTENGLDRARKAMNAWNSERKIEPVGKYREFIRDLKNAIMLEVAAVTYNNVDEQTLKSWVEQAKKEGFGSAIKGVQGKKVILDVY